MNHEEPDSNAEAFVKKWSAFTQGDSRREELLRRVARIHECLSLVLDDPKARAGERVRAAEAALKSCETFARATKLNLKDAAGSGDIDTWDSLLNFVKEFNENYAKAENFLRHQDEEGFAEYKRRYSAFLNEQSASGDLAARDLTG